MTAKTVVDLGLTRIINKPLVCLVNKDKELPKVVEVVVYKELNYKEL
jgi:hypothetical protein